MSHHNDHQDNNPPVLLYISVLLMASITVYVLINFAARPWGWPQGSVEQMRQAEGLTGDAAGGHH